MARLCRELDISPPEPNAPNFTIPAGDNFPSDLQFIRIGPDILSNGSLNPHLWHLLYNTSAISIPGEEMKKLRGLEDEEKKLFDSIISESYVSDSSSELSATDDSSFLATFSHTALFAFKEILTIMLHAMDMLKHIGIAAYNLGLIRKIPEDRCGPRLEDLDEKCMLGAALYSIYEVTKNKNYPFHELNTLWDKHFGHFSKSTIPDSPKDRLKFFYINGESFLSSDSLTTFKEELKNIIEWRLDFFDKRINEIKSFLFPNGNVVHDQLSFSIGYLNRRFFFLLIFFLNGVMRPFDSFCYYYQKSTGDFDMNAPYKQELQYIQILGDQRARTIITAVLKLACNQYIETPDYIQIDDNGQNFYVFTESSTDAVDKDFLSELTPYYKDVFIIDNNFLDYTDPYLSMFNTTPILENFTNKLYDVLAKYGIRLFKRLKTI
jgi:hypothetical protein